MNKYQEPPTHGGRRPAPVRPTVLENTNPRHPATRPLGEVHPMVMDPLTEGTGRPAGDLLDGGQDGGGPGGGGGEDPEQRVHDRGGQAPDHPLPRGLRRALRETERPARGGAPPRWLLGP